MFIFRWMEHKMRRTYRLTPDYVHVKVNGTQMHRTYQLTPAYVHFQVNGTQNAQNIPTYTSLCSFSGEWNTKCPEHTDLHQTMFMLRWMEHKMPRTYRFTPAYVNVKVNGTQNAQKIPTYTSLCSCSGEWNTKCAEHTDLHQTMFMIRWMEHKMRRTYQLTPDYVHDKVNGTNHRSCKTLMQRIFSD